MVRGLCVGEVMKGKGRHRRFRPTGQTGIRCTGDGGRLEAVFADFMAGSVEWVTPENEDDHWDLIEGQGSLFHMSYSGVTLALIHGGQPDALVLCHEPSRPHMRGLPDHAMPSLEDLQSIALTMARMSNPAARVIGISVNTSSMSDEEAVDYLKGIEAEFGMPAVDPFRQGAERLAEALQ